MTSQSTTGQAVAAPSWGKRLLSAGITIAVLLVVFVGVVPRFADYGDAASALATMTAAGEAAVLAFAIANLFVYVLAIQRATPGLRYGPAFVVSQTAFAISNGVPAGGAVGLGVRYAMLAGYGIPPAIATGSIAVQSVWNTLVTIGMPAVAMLVSVVTLTADPRIYGPGLLGLLIVTVAGALLALVVRSERIADALGRWADRIARRAPRRFRPEPGAAERGVLSFRSGVEQIVRRRWWSITWSSLLAQLTSFGVLYAALWGMAQGSGGSAPEPVLAFAAFCVSRLAMMIPITPGGLGTVDAALISTLVSAGADNADAVAAVLVWRAATFIPQVLVGGATFVYWRTTAARRARALATAG